MAQKAKTTVKETGKNLNARWDGWVRYRWIALIDGKVRRNAEEYTTAFLHSDWLYFLLESNIVCLEM